MNVSQNPLPIRHPCWIWKWISLYVQLEFRYFYIWRISIFSMDFVYGQWFSTTI